MFTKGKNIQANTHTHTHILPVSKNIISEWPNGYGVFSYLNWKPTLSIFPSKTNWCCNVDICCHNHLKLPDVYVSPDSLRKKPILLNGSSIHSIDFPTILQKLKAACRLWKSCIRLVLVSTWGRPSREQRSSSFSCETTKTINPVPERKRKHTATLCSTTLLHLIFQSLPHRQELDPVKSMCICVWRVQNLKKVQHLYYP